MTLTTIRKDRRVEGHLTRAGGGRGPHASFGGWLIPPNGALLAAVRPVSG
jgi:hypothetical protein